MLLTRPIATAGHQAVPSSTRRKRTVVLALPGLVVGAIAALPRLTRPALWFDEASSLGAIHDLSGTARQSGGTMSMYYAVLRVWSVISTDPLWLRGLSLLLALVALLGTVRLSRRWLDDIQAAGVGVFLGLSYLWADQAAEARSYPMALVLAVWSWAALDRIVASKGHDRTSALAYLVLWSALPPTHGLLVLVLGAQIGTLLLARVDRRTWSAALPGIIVGMGFTMVLWLLGGRGVTNWVQPTSAYGILRMALVSTGPTPPVAAVMALVIVLGVGAEVRRASSSSDGLGRFRALAPVLWGLVPITGLVVLSAKTPLLVTRYLVCATPGVAMLLVAGVRQTGDLVDRRRRSLVLGSVGTVVLGCLLVGQQAAAAYHGDRWDQAAAVIEAHAREGDGLLLPERRNRVPFEAAWSGSAAVEPELLDFPRPLGEVRYVEPTESRDSTLTRLAGHDRVWLVYQKVFEPSVVARRRLLRAPELVDRFRLVRTWTIAPTIEVRLYDRR